MFASAKRPGTSAAFLLAGALGLRADHLGCYGYAVPTSPATDRVAAEGVRFERCTAQAPWTSPSLFSMMSGEFPSVLWADQPVAERARRFVDKAPTLATVLRSAACRTAAITEGGAAGPPSGLYQGFQSYCVVSPPRVETTCREALAWLREHAGDRFFLFVQTREPCPPYREGPFTAEAPGPLARAMAGYDSSIAHADALVGSLMDALRQLGIADRTLVVITSAHGQDFSMISEKPGVLGTDVGIFGHSLRQSVLHVPLIMRAPGLAPAGRSFGSAWRCWTSSRPCSRCWACRPGLNRARPPWTSRPS